MKLNRKAVATALVAGWVGTLLLLSAPARAVGVTHILTLDTDPEESFAGLGDTLAAYPPSSVLQLNLDGPKLSLLDLFVPDLRVSDVEVYEFAIARPVMGSFDSFGETTLRVLLSWQRIGADPAEGDFQLELTTGVSTTLTPIGQFSLTGQPLDANDSLSLVAVRTLLLPGNDTPIFSLAITGRLSEIPEPGTALLLAAGLSLLAGTRRAARSDTPHRHDPCP